METTEKELMEMAYAITTSMNKSPRLKEVGDNIMLCMDVGTVETIEFTIDYGPEHFKGLLNEG